MDLSLVGQNSYLISALTENKQNDLPTTTSAKQSQSQERSFLSALKQNMQFQEKDRIKHKIERQAKSKDITIGQLIAKCEYLQRENKQKINNINRLNKKNQELEEQVTKISDQNENKQKKYRNDLERLTNFSKQSITILKEQLKKIQQQNDNLKNSLAVLSKEHKVSNRRLNATLEQTKKELQSRLIVREKQQQKVEQMLQKKKSQFQQVLLEREIQNNSLREQNELLRSSLNDLQVLLQNTEDQMNQETEFYNNQCNQLKQQKEGLILQLRQETIKREKINQSLMQFGTTIQLATLELDEIAIIQNYQQQLHPLKQQYQFKIKEMQEKLAETQKVSKEQTNKILVLQEENTFIKTQINKKEDFVTIIREHLSKNQNKELPLPIIKQPALSKYLAPIKSQILQPNSKYMSHPTTNEASFQQLPSNEFVNSLMMNRPQLQHYNTSNQVNIPERHSLTRSVTSYTVQKRTPLVQCNESKKQMIVLNEALKMRSKSVSYLSTEPSAMRVKNKTANQYLKDELQKKKRSLVYIMYKRQEDNPTPTKIKNKPMNDKQQKIRKRSISMNELVSSKCKERIQ